MSKRHKILTTTLLVTASFLSLVLFFEQTSVYHVFLLSLFSLVLFVWSLSDALARNATLLVLLLPALFVFGVGTFWFLLPTGLLSTLPVVILIAAGLYALALTSNIFAVSVVRVIALLRAAKGVGFVMTLFTFFLLADGVLSLRGSLLSNFLFIFLVSFPLYLQGLWNSVLSPDIGRELWVYALVFSYLTSAMSVMIYFWPVSVVLGSIFLTVLMYMLLGTGQAQLERRLFRKVLREYLIVGVLVFASLLFATSWRG